MTAFLRLAAAGLLILAGTCHAQPPANQIPFLQAGTIDNAVTDRVDDRILQQPQRSLESNDTDWQFSQGSPQELPSHELPDLAIELEETCGCGQKHCHGVCRDPGHPKKPRCEKPGDVDRGDCPPLRYRIPDCQRAGDPHCVAKWAKCGINGKYSVGLAGGGAAFFRGRPRHSDEGTWGLDYDGFFGHANHWLQYTRDRHQGGEGAYRTDGEPKIVSRVHNLFGHGH